MATPLLLTDNANGFDDVTADLLDLARQMAAQQARAVSPEVGEQNLGTRVVVDPTDATRAPAGRAAPFRRTSTGSRVSFTLAISGSVDPLSLGVLVILIGLMVTLIGA
ncbi:TPA: hypothetical protein QDB45_005304 [Burkholderia vietnamiensis]|nr:hypothetical protein [Burkholderia vietnamiensis]